jgi:hypothetical protein
MKFKWEYRNKITILEQNFHIPKREISAKKSYQEKNKRIHHSGNNFEIL